MPSQGVDARLRHETIDPCQRETNKGAASCLHHARSDPLDWDRDTLYFRLSVVWFCILAVGALLLFFC